MNISPNVVITTTQELQERLDRSFAAGVKRGRFEQAAATLRKDDPQASLYKVGLGTIGLNVALHTFYVEAPDENAAWVKARAIALSSHLCLELKSVEPAGVASA